MCFLLQTSHSINSMISYQSLLNFSCEQNGKLVERSFCENIMLKLLVSIATLPVWKCSGLSFVEMQRPSEL